MPGLSFKLPTAKKKNKSVKKSHTKSTNIGGGAGAGNKEKKDQWYFSASKRIHTTCETTSANKTTPQTNKLMETNLNQGKKLSVHQPAA